MEKLVQIVHLSDIHLASRRRQRQQEVRTRSLLHRLAQQIPLLQDAVDFIERGISGHDEGAKDRLEEAINEIAEDPPWEKIPRLLLVTGDLTTWGDHDDVEACLKWIDKIAGSHGFQTLVAYGNHDVWAQELPHSTSNQDLDANRTELRSRFFTQPWPLRPCVFQGSRVDVSVHSLNTVLHDRYQNTFACGLVQPDHYWVTSPTGQLSVNHQLTLLRRQMNNGRPDVRIVATHHPVHFPPDHAPKPPLVKRLIDAAAVAQALAKPAAGAVEPAFEVVLSGHTHRAFPPFGELPGTPPQGSDVYGPLLDGQVQMIAGTACQKLWKQGLHAEQSFNLLRVYEGNAPSDRVKIHRIIYRTNNGAGDYLPECDPNDRSAIVNEIVL